MRGGYIHERCLLEPIESAFRDFGIPVWHQVATRPGRDTGYVDLVAEFAGVRLVIEAETTSRRVGSDLRKAADSAHGCGLWSPTPVWPMP